MGEWITISLKVNKHRDNEAEGWEPDAYEVAAVIREKLEDVDFDMGWVITKVSV
jgi:hypothetical protein